MPDVPNLPGVPLLASYSQNNVTLVAADAIIAGETLASTFFPQWGIYYNGIPVITPPSLISTDINSILAPIQSLAALAGIGLPGIFPTTATFVKFEFKQDWPTSDYPIEQGSFQSYDKVQLPFDVRLILACSGNIAQRQSFLNSILSMASNGANPFVPSLAGGSFSAPLNLNSVSTGAPLPVFSVVTPEMSFPSVSLGHIDWARTADSGGPLPGLPSWVAPKRLHQAREAC